MGKSVKRSIFSSCHFSFVLKKHSCSVQIHSAPTHLPPSHLIFLFQSFPSNQPLLFQIIHQNSTQFHFYHIEIIGNLKFQKLFQHPRYGVHDCSVHGRASKKKKKKWSMHSATFSSFSSFLSSCTLFLGNVIVFSAMQVHGRSDQI